MHGMPRLMTDLPNKFGEGDKGYQDSKGHCCKEDNQGTRLFGFVKFPDFLFEVKN